tara:strand:- start:8262 stop:8912 length:651 start_codon:yes stop_codon:yes gene_type:complete
MATTITEVSNNNIKHCLLIDLQIDSTTYYISNSWKSIVYDSNTYQELGAFISVGEFQEDIKTTNGDLSIVLTGIPAGNVQTVLQNQVKGGSVTIYRAFFDDSYAVSNVYPRYKGIITNYNISEQVDIENSEITNTVGINVASINTILENRVNGQRTSPTDRDNFFPGDQTFDRVPVINGTTFDFGREYTGGGGYGGGGGGGGGGRNNNDTPRYDMR